MGTGTDAARAMGNKAHADAIDNMKDQLLIILVKRLGGQVAVTLDELDNSTKGMAMMMNYDMPNATFNFTVPEKK